MLFIVFWRLFHSMQTSPPLLLWEAVTKVRVNPLGDDDEDFFLLVWFTKGMWCRSGDVCVCVCVCVWMCVNNGKLVYVLFFAIYYMYTAILHAGIIRKTLTARSIIHELLLVIVVNNSEWTPNSRYAWTYLYTTSWATKISSHFY
jgi:hypothetical protein